MLAWLIARWTKLITILDTWYIKIKYVAIIYYDRVIKVCVSWYSKISKLVDDWYTKIGKVAIDWYFKISKFVNDWYTKIAQVAIVWYSKISKVVVDWYLKIWTFVDLWYAKIKNVAIDWYDRLKSMAVDGWANLKKVYIDWFAQIKNVAVDWREKIKDVAVDWRPKISKFVNDWFAKIRNVAVDWRGKISKYVNDWFAHLKQYVLDWRDNLGKVATDYFTPIYSFFEDPAAMVFAIIEAYFWGWAEWFFSTLLGGVYFDPPKRPKIGGMRAPPIDGPPGPGKIVPGLQWPCNARRISGYQFNPPSHNGLDIGTPLGAPIWSIASGVVSLIKHSNTGYGNRVEITHDNGAWSRYGHLSKIYVWQGKKVGQGFTIGAAGSTGNSSGPHLHIEIKYNGVYVDPAQVLK